MSEFEEGLEALAGGTFTKFDVAMETEDGEHVDLRAVETTSGATFERVGIAVDDFDEATRAMIAWAREITNQRAAEREEAER